MKTATAPIQIVALAALFVAHLAFAHDFHGIRRAMRTISSVSAGQSLVVAWDGGFGEAAVAG
jgi:hypothetical protein